MDSEKSLVDPTLNQREFITHNRSLVVELNGTQATTFNDTDLLMGAFSSYRLSIVNSLCEGPLTGETVVRAAYNAPGDIHTPMIVNGSSLPSLTLRWNTSAHAQRYRLHFLKLRYDYDVNHGRANVSDKGEDTFWHL